MANTEKTGEEIVLFAGRMWDHRPVCVVRKDDEATVKIGDFSFILDTPLLVDLSTILCMATDKMIALEEGNTENLREAEKAIAERNAEVNKDLDECPDCGGPMTDA